MAYHRTIPLATYYLWSSTMERAGHFNAPAPVAKPDMILPQINTHHGGHIKRTQPIHDELAAGYARMSANYWRGVEERKRAYRRAIIQAEYERVWKRLDTIAKCDLTHGAEECHLPACIEVKNYHRGCSC
jgi:hypothetical protein